MEMEKSFGAKWLDFWYLGKETLDMILGLENKIGIWIIGSRFIGLVEGLPFYHQANLN